MQVHIHATVSESNNHHNHLRQRIETSDVPIAPLCAGPALALVVSLSSLGLLSKSKKQFKFYNPQTSTRLAQLAKQDNIFLILWTNSVAGQRTLLNMIAYTLHYDHQGVGGSHGAQFD